MDYSSIYLGRPLYELEIDKVSHFFKERRVESDQIEFKSLRPGLNLDQFFKNLKKAIAAFLNSNGGLIICGSPEKQKGVSGEEYYCGELTYYDGIPDKDSFISKLSDGIIPLPKGIRVQILSVDLRSIFVIEIDPSNYAPHQFENTYPMRIDGQNKPAPHHYVEALFKRITYPEIEGYITMVSIIDFGIRYQIRIMINLFNFSPLQNEEKLSFTVIAEGIFDQSQFITPDYKYQNAGKIYIEPNIKDVFHFGDVIQVSQVINFEKITLPKEPVRKIALKFGGRYSPPKSSEYMLDFNLLNVDRPHQMLIPKFENKMTKEIQDEIGMTKEKVLKGALKR